MMIPTRLRIRGAVVLLSLTVWISCGDRLNVDFPRPSEPLEATLHDLVAGPIDRPSGFNVVSGRSAGSPGSVRVDESDRWDVAFAVLDGAPVWLPRGFFDGLEPSSGILRLTVAFDQVREVPENRDLYETRQPVPISEAAVYAIRSRQDPTLSLPCRIYAKLEVLSIQGDPAQVRFRFLWNPNCDDRNVTPGDQG